MSSHTSPASPASVSSLSKSDPEMKAKLTPEEKEELVRLLHGQTSAYWSNCFSRLCLLILRFYEAKHDFSQTFLGYSRKITVPRSYDDPDDFVDDMFNAISSERLSNALSDAENKMINARKNMEDYVLYLKSIQPEVADNE
jgi:hypothetical protein